MRQAGWKDNKMEGDFLMFLIIKTKFITVIILEEYVFIKS